MVENQTIGDRIKLIREALSIPRVKFAGQIGIDNSTIGKIEKNLLEPSRRAIMEITSKFGVSLEWLIHGKGNMYIKASMPEIKTEHEAVQSATLKMLFNEVARIKAKIYDITIKDAVLELEQNTTLILNDILKDRA